MFQQIRSRVPQGSILGPLLFNLYINDILKVITESTFIIFADDICLFFGSSSMTQLAETTNSVLPKIDEWSKRNSLDINTKMKLN